MNNHHDPHSTSLGQGSQGDAAAWDAIAVRIDQLAAAWEQALVLGASPPDLQQFVGDLSATSAYPVLVELAKFDIERRWQSGCQPRQAEWYAQQHTLLGPIDNLPVDLIYEEMQARVQQGDRITVEEIRARFPRQAEQLCQLLGAVAVEGSPTCTYFADTVRSDVKPVTEGGPFRYAPGDRVDDFEVVAPLGSGAFARVYLARQVSMERMVALKISRAVGSEPQTLARLDHPHIVRVFDVRQVADPPARLLYMEVVPGGTLLDALNSLRGNTNAPLSGKRFLEAIDRRLEAFGAERSEQAPTRRWLATASWPAVVAWLGSKLAEGLAYAHSRGVLHRDIKPANVLLTSMGGPKLADFNVSYNGGRADEDPADAFGGSLAYMSPEQLEACHPLLAGSVGEVREQSDVYALGVLLWELVAGRRPFLDARPGQGGNLVRLQHMIDARRQADLETLASELPDECPLALRQVLIRCLQPERSRRFASAGELARALQLCLHPRCWQLMQPPTSGIGKLALARPVLMVVLAGLIPNIFIAAFNFNYNKGRIMNETPALLARFNDVQLVINALAFSIGIAVGARAALEVQRLLRRDRPEAALYASRRVLLFGGFISILLLAIWCISGAAFPIAVDWGRPGERSLGFFLHFFLSLALCGCAATAYPYFLITRMTVRYFVPALVRNGVLAGPRQSDLKAVGQLNRVHLALSALVPMLGVVVTVWFGVQEDWALKVVSAVGLVGFGALLLLERSIDADLEALRQVALDDNPQAS